METKWTFKTKNFTVRAAIEPDYDLDLSWDEDGSVAKGIEDGTFDAFIVTMTVSYKGFKVGSDILCGCIYRNFEEFRDHFGCKPKGYCSYFSDMVREAVSEARKTMNGMQGVYLRK